MAIAKVRDHVNVQTPCIYSNGSNYVPIVSHIHFHCSNIANASTTLARYAPEKYSLSY